MMKRKVAAGFLLVLVVAGFQYSCKHEIPKIPGNTTICFESEILPIFQSNCAKSGCHDAASRADGYQLDSYAAIVARGIRAGNAAESKIYEVITDNNPSDIMPQPPNLPLTAAQINKIATWINEGAVNTTNCAAACDTTVFTYSGAIKPIMDTYCTGCHAGEALSGAGIRLDSYEFVKEQVDFDALYPVITRNDAGRMPKNADKLSDCKIAIIRKWIEAGAPNN